MRIAAFDLSLTSTGYAHEAGVGTLTPPSSCSRGIARLRWIRSAVLDHASADLVVLEGYSFASRGQAIVSLGELGGVVRVALADAGVQWVNVPPTLRAKYASGKGNASKEQVLAEAIRRLSYAGHSNDEADALWLRQMALDFYGITDVQLPAAHRDALSRIAWPGAAALNASQEIADERARAGDSDARNDSGSTGVATEGMGRGRDPIARLSVFASRHVADVPASVPLPVLQPSEAGAESRMTLEAMLDRISELESRRPGLSLAIEKAILKEFDVSLLRSLRQVLHENDVELEHLRNRVAAYEHAS